MALVFFLFFVLPLVVVLVVSFWKYNAYSITPAFILDNYTGVFDGCLTSLPSLCTTFATYLSTFKFCLIVWAMTLVLGFTVAYFLAFHVRTTTMQIVLALLCIIPFWTSNVIRMISWIPLLGRNGLINQMLVGSGLVYQPVEWLLYSDFAVALAFVHLLTAFMLVPILNSMMRIDRSLIEAARDAGASGAQVAVERRHPAVEDRHRHRLDLRHHPRHGRLHHHRRHGRPADRLGRQGDQCARPAICSSRSPPPTRWCC